MDTLQITDVEKLAPIRAIDLIVRAKAIAFGGRESAQGRDKADFDQIYCLLQAVFNAHLEAI